MNLSASPPFLLVSAHIGTEGVIKDEIAAAIPESRFAYSRPGLLTFKLADPLWFDPHRLAPLAALCVFPQSLSVSLGKVDPLRVNLSASPTTIPRLAAMTPRWAASVSLPEIQTGFNINTSAAAETNEVEHAPIDQAALAEAAREVWHRTTSLLFLRQHRVNGVHVWHRGALPYTNTETRDTFAARDAIIPQVRDAIKSAASAPLPECDSREGDVILDVILETSRDWWIGCHIVTSAWHTQFAGGIPTLPLVDDAVSRARYKFEEGIQWSRLAIGKGSRCVDLGAAPGGASQALLARGAHVLGVDPGDIAPSVLAHPHFTHIQRRTGHIPRRDLRGVEWVIADMNVAPAYTMTVIEEIVARHDLAIRGLLFTLKLSRWQQAAEILPALANLAKWGYNKIAVRHLAFNRQEVMVAATRTDER